MFVSSAMPSSVGLVFFFHFRCAFFFFGASFAIRFVFIVWLRSFLSQIGFSYVARKSDFDAN